MGPAWVLSVPDGPHVGPRNLFIRGTYISAMQIHISIYTEPSSDETEIVPEK